MKTKTEVRRLAILQAAAEVFREEGFERASMSEIRARVGGSKATLYNYFASKEGLFFEVMHHAKEMKLEAILGALNPDADDLRQELLRFGKQLLTLPYSPEGIAIRRLAIAESGRAGIGKACFERSSVPLEKRLAQFLGKAMRRGSLRHGDPRTAAMHLLSLLESELLSRVLLGVISAVDSGAMSGAARRAVDAFLCGYGADAASDGVERTVRNKTA